MLQKRKGCGIILNPNMSDARCGEEKYSDISFGNYTILCENCQKTQSAELREESLKRALEAQNDRTAPGETPSKGEENGNVLHELGNMLGLVAGQNFSLLPDLLRKKLEAQAPASLSDQWVSDVLAVLHWNAGDLSEDNRIMALAARALILDAPRLDEYAPGLWQDWNGGDRPVKFHDIVDVRFRDGTTSGNSVAGEMVWHHDGEGTDIVAWKLVERAQ